MFTASCPPPGPGRIERARRRDDRLRDSPAAGLPLFSLFRARVGRQFTLSFGVCSTAPRPSRGRSLACHRLNFRIRRAFAPFRPIPFSFLVHDPRRGGDSGPAMDYSGRSYQVAAARNHLGDRDGRAFVGQSIGRLDGGGTGAPINSGCDLARPLAALLRPSYCTVSPLGFDDFDDPAIAEWRERAPRIGGGS